MAKLINSVGLKPTVYTIAVFLIIAGSCGTRRQMLAGTTNADNLIDSMLVDADGNKYAVKILQDNILWMTTNLKLNIQGSYCYENKQENCEQYGRLYTAESAKKGCSLLGQGWRLPAKDEWRQLAELYGGNTEDSNAMRKGAYKALLYTGSSGFNALLGGGREQDGKYARLDAHGFYWTSTEIDSVTAWYYNFGKGSQALYQQDGGEKAMAISVRCVKSVDALK